MQQISVLGLGIIGSRIAAHLVSQGVHVTVWNRSPKPPIPGADIVFSPADAARSSKVIELYLKDRTACMEVFAQMKGELTPEHIILNHSTIDLATVYALAEDCAQIGCTYVDCPFTGSKMPAAQGALVYYVGASESVLEQVRPILERSSKDILHAGNLIGDGTVVKLVTNMISATMVQSLSEALAITKAYGISGELLGKAIADNVIASPLAAFKLPLMEKGDFSTHFSLENMLKDSIYVRELAAAKGLTPPAIDIVSAQMDKLCREGYGQDDFSCLAKQFDTSRQDS